MIDTHCHIDLYDNPLQVATAAEKLGVKTIAVTYLPSHFDLACKHLRNFKHIRPALGLHPLAVKDHQREIPKFLKFFPSAEYIGEVGLDFSGTNKESRFDQEKSFEIVLAKIRQTPKIVTIHSRGAEDAVLRALENAGVGPVIFHWFSGSQKQLLRILNAGHRISLNTSMVSTSKWTELIDYVPRHSVLTETDGPFVKFKGKPAVPNDVQHILRWLAEKWGITIDEATHHVEQNFDRFSLDVCSNAKSDQS